MPALSKRKNYSPTVFDFYETHELFTGNEVLSPAMRFGRVKVILWISECKSRLLSLYLITAAMNLVTELEIEESLRAPITAGDVLGQGHR